MTLLRRCSVLAFVSLLLTASAPMLAQDGRGSVAEPVIPTVCSIVTATEYVTGGEPSGDPGGATVPANSQPDTSRIQAALSACPSGQAVELSASGANDAFLIGPIFVPSGVTLFVDGGVTVFASRNGADYQIGTVSSSQDQCATVGPNGNGCAPLISLGESSVNGTATSTGSGLMGYGIINGRGADKVIVNGAATANSWWDLANLARSGGSQNNFVMVAGYKTNSGVIYKLTFLNNPIIGINLHYNNGFTAWGMKILTPYTARNAAGFSPNSDSNITVNNSVIGDGDDEVAINASNDPVTGLTFENSLFSSGHGLSIGSITTNGVSNVLVNNVNFSGQAADTNQEALHIKSAEDRGGLIQNVTYENICIQNVYQPIQLDPFYDSTSGTLYPSFKNITFANIHVTNPSGAPTPRVEFDGLNSSYVSTVTLDNVVFDKTPIASAAWQDSTITFSNAISGTATPEVYPSFFTTTSGTGVTYSGTASVTNANAINCANAFPLLAGELYAVNSSVTHPNTMSVTNPASFTLNAVVEPTNSETSYAYTGYGSYTGVAAPSASVTFYDGATNVGSGSLSANGTLASVSISNPTAGTHTYTAQYLGDSNYPVQTFGSLTVTVTAGAASQLSFATAPATPIVYGTAPGTVAVSINDVSGSRTTSTASVTLTVSNASTGYSHMYTAAASSGLATFTLSGNLPQVGTYVYTATSGTLTSASANEVVNPATLTVQASAAGRVFDAANPAFGYSISGYVNGDGAAVVSGAPSITTTALQNSAAGAYPITAAVGTLTATNYVFATNGNTLTVTGGAPQSITFFALPAFAHGSAYQLAATSSSGLAVSYSVSGPATVSGSTLSVTGAGTVTVTASQAGNGNYAAAANAQQSFTAQ